MLDNAVKIQKMAQNKQSKWLKRNTNTKKERK